MISADTFAATAGAEVGECAGEVFEVDGEDDEVEGGCCVEGTCGVQHLVHEGAIAAELRGKDEALECGFDLQAGEYRFQRDGACDEGADFAAARFEEGGCDGLQRAGAQEHVGGFAVAIQGGNAGESLRGGLVRGRGRTELGTQSVALGRIKHAGPR